VFLNDSHRCAMIGRAASFPTRKRITEHEMADASRVLRRVAIAHRIVIA